MLTIAKLCNLLRCTSKGEGWRRRIRKDGVGGGDGQWVGGGEGCSLEGGNNRERKHPPVIIS